ncbi:MAG: hypothetical protein ABIE68_03260 [bacterium]
MSKTSELIKITFGVLIFLGMIVSGFYYGYLKQQNPVGIKADFATNENQVQQLSSGEVSRFLKDAPASSRAELLGDLDGDKLSDYLEAKYNTDPRQVDTDYDGFMDGDEAIFGYSPKNKLPTLKEASDITDWKIYENAEIIFQFPQSYAVNDTEEEIVVANIENTDQKFYLQSVQNIKLYSFIDYINNQLLNDNLSPDLLLEMVASANDIETMKIKGIITQRIISDEQLVYVFETKNKFFVLRQKFSEANDNENLLDSIAQTFQFKNQAP